MKTKLLILPVLLIAFAIGFWQCGKPPVTSSEALLLDLTEDHHQHLKFAEYESGSLLSQHPTNGQSIRIFGLNEFSYPPVWQADLPPVENVLLGNEVTRRKEVAVFMDSIKAQLESLADQRMNRERSVIFPVIARELNRLAEQPHDVKKLVAFSDLMELSELANFYQPGELQQLQQKPEQVTQRWLEKHPLPDLTGIDIYLIYQPQGITDNQRFDIVSRFYKQLLESKGATVYISSNYLQQN